MIAESDLCKKRITIAESVLYSSVNYISQFIK